MTTAIKIFMWGTVALVALTFAGYLILSSTGYVADPFIVPQGAEAAGLLMIGFSGIFFGLFMLVCAILWWSWTFDVRRAAQYGRSIWAHSKAGLFWWWFVPIASWWMPRKVHLELFSKATGNDDDPRADTNILDDPARPIEHFVNQWWGWFVAYLI